MEYFLIICTLLLQLLIAPCILKLIGYYMSKSYLNLIIIITRTVCKYTDGSVA